ncbi:hypothetical protein [Microseira sp. BLCC-F43]|uniref:hypothetical protein n=1 Tax=Microseira sp. BLCC-F43 TaxID=3153602 RepID=UPI0035BAAAC5
MNSSLSFKRFSDCLANSLTDIYRVGSLSFVFMCAGVVITLVGHFVNDWLFGIGISLVISCLGFFIYAKFKSLKEISQLIQKNQASIDLAQETAIELTKTFNVIESFTLSHIRSVNRVLDMIFPRLTTFPIVGIKLDKIGISQLQNVSKHIVYMMLKLEKITKYMEKALVNAETQKLEIYPNKLRQISQTLRKKLATQATEI